MTGYGKAEASLTGGKLTVEIRTLNGKSADINIKTSLLPKDKELMVRQKLAERLHRGTIDFFLNFEANAAGSARRINADLAAEYFRQIAEIGEGLGVKTDSALYMNTILRFPDIMDTGRQDIITEDNWIDVESAIDEAIAKVNEYRAHEGIALYRDVTGRVQNILDLEDEVESFDPERIAAIRAKIGKAIEELSLKPDQSRFEEEMIYYLEKFDINESTLRYWETEFPQLKPRTQAGTKVRQYTEQDIEQVRLIYNLVKVRGFKLAAARKMLHENRDGAQKSSEVITRLMGIRKELQDLQKSLNALQ